MNKNTHNCSDLGKFGFNNNESIDFVDNFNIGFGVHQYCANEENLADI